MPIYEYECPKCGVMEISQSITEDPLARCPKCRRKIKRLISLNNFILKGSGWYATDYASKSGGNGGPNGKSAEKKSETKEEKAAKPAESKKSDTSTTSSEASK